MEYEDIIMSKYEQDDLDHWYDTATDAQRAVIDEIIARHELDEEEFNELIEKENRIYYKEQEE